MPVGVEDVVDTVRVEVPVPPGEKMMLAGVTLTVRPAGAETSRFTVPVNPLRLVTVAVEVPDEPCATLRLLGLVVREKSACAAALTVTEIANA